MSADLDRRLRERIAASGVVRTVDRWLRVPSLAWPTSRIARYTTPLLTELAATDASARLHVLAVACMAGVIARAGSLLLMSVPVGTGTWAAWGVLLLASGAAIARRAPGGASPRVGTRVRVAATAAGIAASIAYTASPSAFWFIVAMAGLSGYLCRVLPPGERRWVVGTLLGGIAARVGIVALLPLANDYTRRSFTVLVPDAGYNIERSIWLSRYAAGDPVAARDLFEAFYGGYGGTSYYFVLAAWQLFTGPAPYGVHLFSIALYALAASTLYLLMRQAIGPVASFAGFLPVMFLPSLLFWSSAPLKEAASVCALAGALAAAAAMVRSASRIRQAAALVLLLFCMAALESLRQGGAVLVGGALLGAAMVPALRSRPRLTVVASLALIGVLAAALAAAPRLQAAAANQVRIAASRHMGHVNTMGRSYTLLEPDTYRAGPAGIEALTGLQATRFLAMAAVRFFSVPEPWNIASRLELALLPQQVVWYLMVVAMLPGAWVVARADALVGGLCLGATLAGVALIAPNSGNIGTLVRHRDLITPIVLLLGGAGLAWAMVRVPRASWRRPNPIYLVAALLPLLIIAGVIAYAVFRPVPPEIASVEPAQVTAGQPFRAVLRGSRLRPYLRAFYVPSGQPVELRDGRQGSETAPYFFEGPGLAELDLPGLAPGSYDVVLYERGQELVRRSPAFVVVPESIGALVTGVLLSSGDSFLRAVRAGDLLSPASGGPALRVDSVGTPAPEQMVVRSDGGSVPIGPSGRIGLPVRLLAPCLVSSGRCVAGSTPLGPGSVVSLSASARAFEFEVVRVDRFDAAARESLGTLVVRFDLPAEVAVLMRPGHADHSDGLDDAWAAQIASIALQPGAGSGSVVADVSFEVPLQSPRQGEYLYRGRQVRAGEQFPFETARYAVRGIIVAVSPG